MTKELSFANDLIDFIDKSPNQYYCVQNSAKLLKENGFKELKEQDSWKLNKGDKFYVIRHDSSIIAGIAGEKNVADAGVRMIGSHTDSPGFKLKPKSVKLTENYVQLGVEVYGGPLFSTWTDRELGFSGKVILADENNYYRKEFVNFEEPLLVIPQLAIHYNREANSAFKLNPQIHMLPVMTLSEEKVSDELIKNLVARKLRVEPKEIVNYELYLYPLQKGAIVGFNRDFVMSARLDNQSMVHASIQALINSKEKCDLTRVVACYDNEEVGSSTTNGGNSSFTKDFLKRLNLCFGGSEEDYYRMIAKSYYMSSDGAHAVHPNYPEKFDNLNKVYVNKGPVIKINASTSYASSVESGAFYQIICDKANVPYQKFVNRSDIRGGGTIGSMIATKIGIRTVDVGNAMMAMHSARELCGIDDHWYMYQSMISFLDN